MIIIDRQACRYIQHARQSYERSEHDDARWMDSKGPGASCCIFHLENPFSRFSVATGARACKSNARCPLVNLRVNTHRRDNLRSRRVHSRPYSPSRFFRPFLSVSLSHILRTSRFFGPCRCWTRASRKAKPVRTPRYTESIVTPDVDTLKKNSW